MRDVGGGRDLGDGDGVKAALGKEPAGGGEALTNVGKHAHATRARVTIDIAGRTITAEIADDGIGGAGTTRGSGLRGLADRLDALGGTRRSTAPWAAPPRSAHKPRCRHIPELDTPQQARRGADGTRATFAKRGRVARASNAVRPSYGSPHPASEVTPESVRRCLGVGARRALGLCLA